jgi:hypothetical protein
MTKIPVYMAKIDRDFKFFTCHDKKFTSSHVILQFIHQSQTVGLHCTVADPRSPSVGNASKLAGSGRCEHPSVHARRVGLAVGLGVASAGVARRAAIAATGVATTGDVSGALPCPVVPYSPIASAARVFNRSLSAYAFLHAPLPQIDGPVFFLF